MWRSIWRSMDSARACLTSLVPESPARRTCSTPPGSTTQSRRRVGAFSRFADRSELPLTSLVNSRIYAFCPELIAAFREAGCEIAAHGRTNAERQGQMPEPQERALIAEATAEIATHEGTRPRGWLGPWISESDVTAGSLEGSRHDLRARLVP